MTAAGRMNRNMNRYYGPIGPSRPAGIIVPNIPDVPGLTARTVVSVIALNVLMRVAMLAE